MTIATKYTLENVMCYPVDKERLDALVNRAHKGKGEIFYQTAVRMALIFEPKRSIVSCDFGGTEVGETVRFDVFKCSAGWKDSVVSKYVEFNITDFKDNGFLKPPITLAEFTKDQDWSNKGIMDNSREWLEWFNS